MVPVLLLCSKVTECQLLCSVLLKYCLCTVYEHVCGISLCLFVQSEKLNVGMAIFISDTNILQSLVITAWLERHLLYVPLIFRALYKR